LALPVWDALMGRVVSLGRRQRRQLPKCAGRDLPHLFVLPADWHKMLFTWPIRIVLTVSILIALRRDYDAGWVWSGAATPGLLASHVVINV